MHSNKRLEYGLESTSILARSFVNENGTIWPCNSAIVDVGLDGMDPGIVPNGVKCGEGKVYLIEYNYLEIRN